MRELVGAIRKVEKDHNRPIGILVDLQGPKLRVGAFAGGSAMLDNGATFTFDADPKPGDATRVHLPHPEIFEGVEAGPHAAARRRQDPARRHRSEPSRRSSRASRSAASSPTARASACPTPILPFSALTPKDRSDLDAALDAGIDWIGLSFVQRPEDIAEAKKITRGRAAVMAKIEKPQAVTRIDEIIDLTDAHHGGARRSRRRNAAGEGAGHPEAAHPRRAPRRQAGGGRDADAGKHDLGARCRPAPKCPTSPPRSSTAPTR